MSHEEILQRLEQKGIKPTANRILVYRELQHADRPMCLADMEQRLLSMDKSSIFRVLTLFLEHDAVHTFSDGRGIVHYELCGSSGACSHSDGHLHFYCESCQQSFCLEDVALPDIELPYGYSPHSVSFVIKGECPSCRQRHHD
jgi:Fur family ferric uptake transcriptional regulator